MFEQMKQISRQTAEAGDPAMFLYGGVTAVEPLKILVDSRFELSGEAVVLPRELEGVRVGDRVVLLRNYGGQQYLVLGRV